MPTSLSRRSFLSTLAAGSAAALAAPAASAAGALRAGAAAVDVTPDALPVIINGYFTQRLADKVTDKLLARAVALDDGRTRLVICVVDNLMLPRAVCDEAKLLASRATGVPVGRMLVSATHTHSAGSVMGCLGADADPAYTRQLIPAIAAAIEQAVKRLAPAHAGWSVLQDHAHTHCRRWITRPDKLVEDPFGQPSARAMMHPGFQNPNFLGPSGPVDPDLAMLALRTASGEPLALLANYSMHFVGSTPISADYFGRFCTRFEQAVNTDGFVAILSQGASGDLHWQDYAAPRPNPAPTADSFAAEMVAAALPAYRDITYRADVTLAMAEATLPLNRRVPDENRLAWAREVIARLGDNLPRTRPEIYAREQLLIAAEPQRELKLQAIRVGDFGIAAMPNEVYAITGLKIKLQSPLVPTMNIELANGAEGYIPPPEQHALGGYTTWAARTAGLEVDAEPAIVQTVLKLLEEVSGRKRLTPTDTAGPYVQAVLASRPAGYWRLSQHDLSAALDASGHARHGAYDQRVALFLEGPQGSPFGGVRGVNRAVHFAGGRMGADLPGLTGTYSVELWACNYLDPTLRHVTGYAFSRARQEYGAPGDNLGIGGTYKQLAGRLIVFNGNAINSVLVGDSVLHTHRWHHVAMVRDGRRVVVYLDGRVEIDGEMEVSDGAAVERLFFGGRADNFANFEGRLDELAVYPRALSGDEVQRHYAAAARP